MIIEAEQTTNGGMYEILNQLMRLSGASLSVTVCVGKFSEFGNLGIQLRLYHYLHAHITLLTIDGLVF